MTESHDQILEGIFAISKPPTITTPQVLLDLQDHFAKSRTFAPLLADVHRKREEQHAHIPPIDARQDPIQAPPNARPFKLGHGGTLDPLASGILILGLGRGTKLLSTFLGGRKTYEVVILFGKSTDSFDVSGTITGVADTQHITAAIVEKEIAAFKGVFNQVPPVYSALKINGVKACEYARAGRELPRELEAREVCVDECTMLEFLPAGAHAFRWQSGDAEAADAPAVRVKLSVSSGFYVRSFCEEVGRRCGSLGTMAELVRTRQAGYVLSKKNGEGENLETAVTYEELEAGEEIWGPKVRGMLGRWMDANLVKKVVMNGHGRSRGWEGCEQSQGDGAGDKNGQGVARQRFRGEWQAATRKERIKQQGGKWKGKYNQPKNLRSLESTKEPDVEVAMKPTGV